MTPSIIKYTVIHKKQQQVYVHEGDSGQVREFLRQHAAKDFWVQMWKQDKPCCPDENTYLGQFSAEKALQ